MTSPLYLFAVRRTSSLQLTLRLIARSTASPKTSSKGPVRDSRDLSASPAYGCSRFCPAGHFALSGVATIAYSGSRARRCGNSRRSTAIQRRYQSTMATSAPQRTQRSSYRMASNSALHPAVNFISRLETRRPSRLSTLKDFRSPVRQSRFRISTSLVGTSIPKRSSSRTLRLMVELGTPGTKPRRKAIQTISFACGSMSQAGNISGSLGIRRRKSGWILEDCSRSRVFNLACSRLVVIRHGLSRALRDNAFGCGMESFGGRVVSSRFA